jgi:hypothetical protein
MLWGCGTNKPAKPQAAMGNLTREELMAINRNLSVQVRENFRSWNYKQPERWKYLAGKFADEVVRLSPDAASNREKIAELFLNHLKQRTDIMNSDSKNKQQLMGQSVTELNYNLTFLIGIEGFNKWLALSKNELQKFKSNRDSLNEIVSYAHNKIQKLK